MQPNLHPKIKDLVLIGGGHSHAIVLKMFGSKPLPGIRLTLITPSLDTPYSGMLPGHIAGFYSHEECHINLRLLTNFAQTKLYIDQVVSLDLKNNKVLCVSGLAVNFDILSIDIGSTPAKISVSGAAEYAIAAKPVAQLLAYWDQLIKNVTTNPQNSMSLAIVGGGAGGVELALSMLANLRRILSTNELEVHLFQRNAELLPNYHSSARRQIQQVLISQDINLHLGESVCQISPTNNPDARRKFVIKCESGLTVECDQIFWVTQASAPSWLKESGLGTDEQGFILVDDTLQSLTHPHIFAAGDIATMVNYHLPKAGIFAVRQGKPLFENLQRFFLGKCLQPYKPQKQYLSLIGTGDGRAIATRGTFTLPPHKLFWMWKECIDRHFMNSFRNLPVKV
jgi:pyridine nucleotide-disulfide oxidoreductase family protein